MKVLNSDLHNGSLAPKAEFCRIITPNIQLAALKRAEDEDALIIRLYETDGLDTEAEVCLSGLAASGCEVLETDTLEIPRLPLSARMEDDILKVEVPAYGFRTVMVKGWKKP
jgi:alpha-mannosidase